MRILVIAPFQAGALFAHAINTVKMAQGFARLGHRVTLICRRGAQADATLSPAALARRYALDTPLEWVRLADAPRALGKRWAEARFAWRAWPSVARRRPGLIYTRDYVAPALLSRRGWPIAAETHAHPGTDKRTFVRMLAATSRPSFRALVTISPRLAEHYASRGVPPEKVLVLPDAVDLRQFSRPAEYARGELVTEVTSPRPRVLYSGHLYDYKGIPTVLRAAKLLPEVRFELVGGWPADIQRQRALAATLGLANVTFHGLKAQHELPPYLWRADALLLPPEADHPSASWTSPVKLGEYLAAGAPVIASAIPALRHWLSDDQAAFFQPGDSASLAEAIRRVLDDAPRRDRLIENGTRLAQTLSYERRAAAILRASALAR